MRRKRTSKRRWIKRFFQGKRVPMTAIIEYGLEKRLKPLSLIDINMYVRPR